MGLPTQTHLPSIPGLNYTINDNNYLTGNALLQEIMQTMNSIESNMDKVKNKGNKDKLEEEESNKDKLEEEESNKEKLNKEGNNDKLGEERVKCYHGNKNHPEEDIKHECIVEMPCLCTQYLNMQLSVNSETTNTLGHRLPPIRIQQNQTSTDRTHYDVTYRLPHVFHKNVKANKRSSSPHRFFAQDRAICDCRYKETVNSRLPRVHLACINHQ